MIWIYLILLLLLALIEFEEKDHLKQINKFVLPAAFLIIFGPLLLLYYTRTAFSILNPIFLITGIIQAGLMVGLYFAVDKFVVHGKEKK